tara:strand:+ start:616 stop:3150 length:2535 start_codon:yes stop_codon:yes gene_type:complete
MSIKDCIIEVQSAVQDLFNDEEATAIVNKIKNKIDQKRIAKEIDLSEERIVKEIADEQKKINLIKKLNALKGRKMAFERFTENVENFPGKPVDGLKAMLGGITASNKGSRLSVDNYQLLFKNKYGGGFEEEMSSAGLTDLAKSKEMMLPVFRETFDNPFLRLSDVEKKKMKKMGEQLPSDSPIYDNKYAYDIAKIITKYNNIILDDKNSLGAFISRMPGYIFRQNHISEKMLRAAGDNVKDEASHKLAWINFSKKQLNQELTFKDEDMDKFLTGAWNNLISGHHITTLDANQQLGSRNIANKMSAERVFHFKDGRAFYEYDQKFGHGNLMDSLLMGFDKAGQDVGMMTGLGVNPRNTVDNVITLLRNHYGGTIAKDLNFKQVENVFKELDGSINSGSGNMQAKIGSAIGALQETGKLGNITPTSFFGDLPNMMTEIKHQEMNMFDSMNIIFKELKRTNNKKELQQILKPFNLFAANFVGALNQHAVVREEMTGALSKYRAGFYKYTGFTGLMQRMKSGMFMAMQNHYGILAKTNSWNQLSDQVKINFGLYGIDDGMWNIMRKSTLREFEGYELLTLENFKDIPKNDIISYLNKTQPTLKKITDKKIKETQDMMQSKWRMFLYDRTHHGVLEPGARERSILNQGFERGTTAGLLMRLMTKFKSFPTTVYTRKLELMVKGSGENPKYSNYIPALAYYTVLGTTFGYASLSFADMLMGKEPRDPKDPKTALASFAKGGGGSIYVDLLNSEITRSNGGAASTILGPAFADAEGLFKVLKNTAEGKFDKAGLKAYRLFEANTPIDVWFLRPAYNYLIGYQIKDMIDPGYFDRLKGYTKQNTGQDFFLKP